MFEAARGAPVLAFFAHPDDAELSCFGTLARLRQGGSAIHILHATEGEATSAAFYGHRTEQAREAARGIGAVAHCAFLTDGAVTYDGRTVDVFDQWLRKLAPAVVITHFPQRHGFGHQDHDAVADIATNAVLRASHVDWLLHAEPPLPAPDFIPNLFVDVTAVMDLKIAAIATAEDELQAKGYLERELVVSRGRWWAYQARRASRAGAEAFEAFRVVKGVI